jgi:predicted amidohydrolase YtcJ
VAIGALCSRPDEFVLEANGGLLLPGLHDHHVHLAATAASLSSVQCGPPQVHDEADLVAALSISGKGWLRGIGYHEGVAGMIDRHWIDRVASDRPVRVQHRSGRLWVFNTFALDLLLAAAAPPPQLERNAQGWTGRLFDADPWLRGALGSIPPKLDAVGAMLARFGITSVTDMSPLNDDAMARFFALERDRGALPQRLMLAGKPELGRDTLPSELAPGPVKLHLHEEHLPDYDATVATIRRAHEQAQTVAVHCVSEVELVFTLAALRDAGAMTGDRIEHASVAPDSLIQEIATLGLSVCVQPNFVHERGDAYRTAISPEDWPALYRLQAFRQAGVPLAGGTDTPFGAADPWSAMAAATSRRTAAGETLGLEEALTPEAALDLFLAHSNDFSKRRQLSVESEADLCLLRAPWRTARANLSADLVCATIIGGNIVHDSVDQPPGQRGPRIDATS